MNQNQSTMQREQAQEDRCVHITQLGWQNIAMLEPYLQPNGRTATRVYYSDGSHDTVAHTCEYVVRAMAYHHHTDLRYAQELAKRCSLSSRQRKCALWLGEQCCLIPVKCREINSAHQSTLGYVVMQHMWLYSRMDNGNTLIQFAAGHKGVEILQKTNTVKSQVENAMQIQACHKLSQLQMQQSAAQSQSAPAKPIGHYWD